MLIKSTKINYCENIKCVKIYKNNISTLILIISFTLFGLGLYCSYLACELKNNVYSSIVGWSIL